MTPELDLDLWQTARDRLRQSFGEELYERWLAGLKFVSSSAGEVGLAVPNHWVRDWIRSRYLPQMLEVFREVTGQEVKLSFHIDPALFREQRLEGQGVFSRLEPAPGSAPSVRTGEDAGVRRSPTVVESSLESLVQGSCNQLACSAALQILEAPGEIYNPFFVFGSSGVGKTHLLRGIQRAFQSGGRCLPRGRSADPRGPGIPEIVRIPPNLKVRYLSGEQFFNHFVASVQDRSGRKFRECYRSLDVLILDDIHLLASKKKTQLEFLHTFNSLMERGRQIIVASDTAPKDLQELQPSLVGRLLSGLVARIRKPDYETRLRIVQQRAQRLDSRLDPQVFEFLAEWLRGNVRELIGALMQLDVHARVRGEQLDLETAETVLAEFLHEQRNRITLPRIHEVVARHFGLPMDILVSGNRQHFVSLARQVAMYLARRYTRKSLAEIGKYFGRRKHTTVKSAVSKISKLLQTADPAVSQDLPAIIDSLEGN